MHFYVKTHYPSGGKPGIITVASKGIFLSLPLPSGVLGAETEEIKKEEGVST